MPCCCDLTQSSESLTRRLYVKPATLLRILQAFCGNSWVAKGRPRPSRPFCDYSKLSIIEREREREREAEAALYTTLASVREERGRPQILLLLLLLLPQLQQT